MYHPHGSPPILDERGHCAICGEEIQAAAIGTPKEKIRIEPVEVPVPSKTPAPVEVPEKEKEPVR